MTAEEGLLSLIGRMYELGLEADQWPVMLDEIAAHFDCVNVAYICIDRRDDWRTVNIIRDPEPDSPKRLNCLKVYNELPPGSDIYYRAVRRPENRDEPILIGHRIVDRDELKASAHFNEVLLPAGLHDHLIMPISGDGAFNCVVNLYANTPDRLFSDDDLRQYMLLKSHLVRLIGLQRKFHHRLRLGDLTAAALDALSFGVIIVNAAAKIEFANKRAAAHLSRRDGIMEASGKLNLADAEAGAKLRYMIETACGARIGGVRNGAGGGLACKRPGGAAPLGLSVFPFDPLASAQTVTRFASERSALIVIADPNEERPANDALLAAIYGLTPAETRIARLMIEGHSQKEMAERLSITENTMRWHVKSMLRKTETSREAELVMRLSRVLPSVEED